MDLHYVLRENKAWSCVSIFYSRKDWTTLLLEIVSFYQYNEKIFNCFQVNFSEKRGEHIRITFSSDVENMKMIQSFIWKRVIKSVKKSLKCRQF